MPGYLNETPLCQLSRRGFDSRMFQSMVYEWEDVVAEATGGLILAPESQPAGTLRRARMRVRNRWERLRGGFDDEDPGVDTRDLAAKPDVFVFNLMRLHQVSLLRKVPNWRKQSRHAICCVFEIWDTDFERFDAQVRALAEFDTIFSVNPFNLDRLSTMTGRSCHYLPPAVDALRFCPATGSGSRPVDCYTMGRRDPVVHAALERLAGEGDLLYLYDTARSFEVTDRREHRRMLARILQRSKFTVCSRREECDMVLSRMMEAAAAGCIMLGDPPQTEEFRSTFDWRNAVVPIGEENAGRLGEILAELAQDAAGMQRTRENGIRAALERFDWIYRWEQVRAAANLPSTPGEMRRKARLAERIPVPTAAQALTR